MEWKPKFEWPLSPRRPRCPSSVSSSSSSRLPSFSSDTGDSFISAEDRFDEDKRESSVYSKEAIAGGYGGHAALQFVVPTSRYAWWRWRRKPQYRLPNVPDPSRASSKPGAASAHLPLTTCSTNSTLTVTSYKEGSPCDFRLTPRTEGEILSFPNLKAFTFYELKSATRNFRPDSLIGEGGFGFVFKGWIDGQTFTASKPGSGMVVAVKKLKPEDFSGHREWLTEVNYLGQLHHPNLVKLIGFCSQDDNRLLVYEYMPRGSLNNHLFRRGPQTLSWAIRLKVAIGAAKLLTFLHEAESQVIYRNVKASHILLDSDFNAKLSGFDLARAGPTGDETHVTTRVMGTVGYAAPEYILTGHLSAKADVYSFGVVLLELLSGRPAWDRTKSKAEVDLVEWARPCLRDKQKLFRIMDPKLEGRYPEKGAHFVAMLAKQCISRDPKLRAPMSAVLAALEQLSRM